MVMSVMTVVKLCVISYIQYTETYIICNVPFCYTLYPYSYFIHFIVEIRPDGGFATLALPGSIKMFVKKGK